MSLGTAYQIYDDCLDLFGVEGLAGKTLGSDLAKGKVTLPVLLLLERAAPAERVRIREWLPAWEPSDLPRLKECMDRHQTLSLSIQTAESLLEEARRALGDLPDGVSRESLAGLTRFLAAQLHALAEASRVPVA